MDAGVMARAEAILQSGKDFADGLPQPENWKQFMGIRYPTIPEDVKLLHVIDWLPQPLPPLKVLCPPAGHTIQPWGPSISGWLDQLPNRPLHSDLMRKTLMPHKIFLMGHTVVERWAEGFRPFSSQGISRPEATVQARSGAVLVVLLVDLFNLPGDLDTVLNRLFHYLELTGASFGAVTCYSSTWLCMRDGQDSEGRPLLWVSPPDDRPALAIGFLVTEAVKKRSSVVPPVEHACTRVPASFDMSPVLALLKGMCETLSVEDAHVEKIVSRAAEVSGTFGIEDLQNVRLLPSSREKDAKMNKTNVRTVIKGLYKGEAVVVKTRDLTSPYCIGFEGSLERFVREVDAHITLRKLQGRVVPELLSWGFLRGGMFVYVMTRDAGNDKLESDEAGESQDPNRRRVLHSASAALAEVHKRGILHGDIDVNKVVTKQDEAGQWTAMLVGFAQSSRVEVLSQEWSLGAAKEMAELGKFIDFLVQDSAFREKRNKAHAPTSGPTFSTSSSSSLF